MLRDHAELSSSAASRRTLDHLEQAADALHGFRDPMPHVEAMVTEEPDFTHGWTVRGAMLALTSDAAFDGEVRRSLEQAEAGWDKATDRERAHVTAVLAWLEGDHNEATARWGRIAQDHPRDLLALQFAHTGDFFLGQASELRDRPAQALRAWGPWERGTGYIHGMHAFGLEESGQYDRAFDAAERALALNPKDVWAIHARAHVHEMRGEAAEGAAFLTRTTDDWAEAPGLSVHNWWHLALCRLDAGDHGAVLALYDANIRPKEGVMMLELVDASALLWRLHLAGVDVRERFEDLARDWTGRTGQGAIVFNELHGAMAFAGAGRFIELEALVRAVWSRAETPDAIGLLFREVGAPLVAAVQAFAERRYGEAADALAPVRARARRMGGSEAQRDVLSLTLLEAARRAGRAEQASAFAAERLSAKPDSPFNRMLAGRVSPALARAA